jgi:hypothetical protein
MFESAPLATGWGLADCSKLRCRLAPSNPRVVGSCPREAAGNESFVGPRGMSQAAGRRLARQFKCTEGCSAMIPAAGGGMI